MKSFIRRVPPRFETRMLHILICNLSTPCPCLCLVRKWSSVFESGIVIRSEVDRGEYNIRYTAIVAQQCGGCSYLQNAAGGDIGKSVAGSATGSSQILRTGILPAGFRMRQHICESALSMGGESRMRYSKTVLLLMERVCRCWAHRTGPMYVMKPWLGYIAYPGGVHI